VSKKLQLKFEHLQNGSIETDCDEISSDKREFLYDLDNVNAVGCGLGCQLHGISAAFICAFENNRKLSLINYQRNQYDKYFNAFKSKCERGKKIDFKKISSKFCFLIIKNL
jgi:hypothetical protein